MNLKFRVWTGTEMIEPDYIRNGIAYWSDGVTQYESENTMIYIGLKDKKSKFVFENDIVVAENHINPNIFQIRFIEGGFCACHDLLIFPFDINHFYPSTGCMIEVIGNIYANPELLKLVNYRKVGISNVQKSNKES